MTKQQHVRLSLAFVALLTGSAAFGQNTITTEDNTRGQLVQTPEGDFQDRVIPGWEHGMYAFVGMGVYQLHTQVSCPYQKDGCAGNEVVNLTSGNQSQFDVGLGWRFNPYIALEATAAILNGGDNTSHEGATARDLRLAASASQEPSWDAQPLRLRLDLPIMTGLSVYGTAGVGIKAISAAIGELDAKSSPGGGCIQIDDQTGKCLVVDSGGYYQAVSDPPRRVYFPVSVGAEWWIFKSPDWALNINYQPPQGSGSKFYRFSVSIVGALGTGESK